MACRATADTRTRVLDAAARVYAEHGFHGATTRLIAEHAEVNEVTIFRLFGTKEALLAAAVRAEASREPPGALPAVPQDPARELAVWCEELLARLRAQRDLLRTCFAESATHPALVADALGGFRLAGRMLADYVAALRAQGRVRPDADAEAAQAMLLAALIADALGRDQMPEVYPVPTELAPGRYVGAFLSAIRRA